MGPGDGLGRSQWDRFENCPVYNVLGVEYMLCDHLLNEDSSKPNKGGQAALFCLRGKTKVETGNCFQPQFSLKWDY